MKKYLALMILPVLLIAGCESEQASQPQSTSQSATTSTPTQTEQSAADNSATAVDAASSETTADTGNIEATKTEVVQMDTAQTTQQSPRTGEAVYQQFCINCHKTGVANAPKFADKAAWEPRIAKGKDVLYQSAINGVAGTAMTPKGSCMNCSDDELKAAVDYMVENAQQSLRSSPVGAPSRGHSHAIKKAAKKPPFYNQNLFPYYDFLRLATPNKPIKPEPNNHIAAGTGTGLVVIVKSVA